jgi:hypothetical protein
LIYTVVGDAVVGMSVGEKVVGAIVGAGVMVFLI